ncbi:hypothetical protein T492DRAFT_858249 [Pavlovales sp. CCMP2436]|nr:hypothetical protein T492DRAFT_858249 [Pavlovales sp. CCMP2436]
MASCEILDDKQQRVGAHILQLRVPSKPAPRVFSEPATRVTSGPALRVPSEPATCFEA